MSEGMSSRSKILIGILIVLILGAVGWFVWQSSYRADVYKVQPTPNIANTKVTQYVVANAVIKGFGSKLTEIARKEVNSPNSTIALSAEDSGLISDQIQDYLRGIFGDSENTKCCNVSGNLDVKKYILTPINTVCIDASLDIWKAKKNDKGECTWQEDFPLVVNKLGVELDTQCLLEGKEFKKCVRNMVSCENIDEDADLVLATSFKWPAPTGSPDSSCCPSVSPTGVLSPTPTPIPPD